MQQEAMTVSLHMNRHKSITVKYVRTMGRHCKGEIKIGGEMQDILATFSSTL